MAWWPSYPILPRCMVTTVDLQRGALLETSPKSAGAVKFFLSRRHDFGCISDQQLAWDDTYRARGCPPPLAADPPPKADFFFSLHGMPVPDRACSGPALGLLGLASSGRRAWKDVRRESWWSVDRWVSRTGLDLFLPSSHSSFIPHFHHPLASFGYYSQPIPFFLAH